MADLEKKTEGKYDRKFVKNERDRALKGINRRNSRGGGKPPEGWEQHPWSIPENQRQLCGYFNNCSLKCRGYGKIKTGKGTKFFDQCQIYSWPLKTETEEQEE